ncbi:ABC transporter permease [Candidatus Uhrbacteria bacterium]|nr:ABC transporter permease [Candidatus Uhrbacteria bacterium]
MISHSRIRALLLQEWHLSKRSLEIIVDTAFFSVIDILVLGYVSMFLLGTSNGLAARYLIFGAIWWEVIRVTQYSMTMNSLWNIWARNLSNMFIAPLSLREYFIAICVSATMKSAVIAFGVLVPLAAWVFHFQLFSIGFAAVALTFINLILFSWAIGILLLGLIFRFGVRVQAIAWAFIFIFQPLTAVFYPVSVLPPMLQHIALAIPLTHIFEAGRYVLQYGQMPLERYLMATIFNIALFVFSLCVFRYLLRRAKDTGQFVRNES